MSSVAILRRGARLSSLFQGVGIYSNRQCAATLLGTLGVVAAATAATRVRRRCRRRLCPCTRPAKTGPLLTRCSFSLSLSFSRASNSSRSSETLGKGILPAYKFTFPSIPSPKRIHFTVRFSSDTLSLSDGEVSSPNNCAFSFSYLPFSLIVSRALVISRKSLSLDERGSSARSSPSLSDIRQYFAKRCSRDWRSRFVLIFLNLGFLFIRRIQNHAQIIERFFTKRGEFRCRFR